MALFVSVAAVPVQMESNQTHSPAMSHLVQRTLNDSSGASKAPHTLHPVAPSYNHLVRQTPDDASRASQSHNQTATLRSHRPQSGQDIQISRRLTQASSGLKATKAPNKVEEFAKKLRADMEAQERTLNVYIKTIQDRHTSTQSKLNKVKSILNGLKAEIANATKYANQYQSQDTDLSKQDTLYRAEYEKSKKMYEDEKQNIAFERQFIDQIIKYIQLRKC
jgi:hypothetical protein